jgi:hypothetical protein
MNSSLLARAHIYASAYGASRAAHDRNYAGHAREEAKTAVRDFLALEDALDKEAETRREQQRLRRLNGGV